ncbi:hypothetical protein A0J61_10838 [Choanephora cucurbitarum]|uniref:Uncharacterized protein n=1 Tax=Choanephora cucurbitarum TaxID=101091 RepID=A0A1C7MWC7_9FUNG|nr:hypothetical protein A0J61_10838 [Choanephora cucurbitarum]
MNECVVNVAEDQENVVLEKRGNVKEATHQSMEGLLNNSNIFGFEDCEVNEAPAQKNRWYF